LKEKLDKKTEPSIATALCIGKPEKLFHDNNCHSTTPIPPEIFEVIRRGFNSEVQF
jgi:hypothetical protein